MLEYILNWIKDFHKKDWKVTDILSKQTVIENNIHTQKDLLYGFLGFEILD